MREEDLKVRFVKNSAAFLAVAGASLALSIGAAHASIVELSMTTGINATTHNTVYPYMAPGDTVTLTVRYDTDTVSSGAFGGTTLYKNAITYFGFEIERAGVTTYSGGVSGAFGQVQISDNAGPAGNQYDGMTFRIFDDQVDYPSGTRSGTTPAGAIMPVFETGDTEYGYLFFRDFLMHFTIEDESVLGSEALPTAEQLMVYGVSPFGPHNGTTPWSGVWEFENRLKVLGGMGSFGPGAPRDGEQYSFASSVGDYTPGDVSEVPLPASLPLFAAGFAAVAGLRRKTARKRG